MSRVDRAAQFLPFDALKGLHEELKKREEKLLRVPKRKLSDEETEELATTLLKIEKGSVIEVTFYYNGHYVQTKGTVVAKDDVYKCLTIDKAKLFYDDIAEIKIVNV